MYVIRVGLEVRHDALERFEALVHNEAQEVPQRFEGCLRYAFHKRVGRPTSFLLYEEWRDQAAFEAYRQSPYFVEIGEQIRPLLAGAPDSAYYLADPVPTAIA